MLALRINRCRCSHASRTLARTYSTESSIPALPPGAKWKVEFPIQNTLRRERPVMHNPESAREVARSFLSKPAIADGGKIVIEAFPGPGALSRAMLELPESKLSKLIILEDDPVYLNGLKPLEEADSRVKVVPMSGHVWDTYTHLEEHGYLEGLKPQPIEGPIPNLHFVAHLPQSVKGEQLIAQLFRCIPEQSWLFQYGRVPMSFLLNNLMYGRVTARPKAKARCKLSVIAEACAEVEDAVDPEMLAPYEEHFYPLPAASGIQKPSTKRVGQPMHAITATPYSEPVIQRGEIDKWDYCLRRLFVLKTTPLKTALSSLAPGATSLLKDLTSGGLPSSQRVNVAKTIKDLTVADWTLILRAFNNWPFRPEDLMITDGFKDSE